MYPLARLRSGEGHRNTTAANGPYKGIRDQYSSTLLRM
jgi:hypothetical protein